MNIGTKILYATLKGYAILDSHEVSCRFDYLTRFRVVFNRICVAAVNAEFSDNRWKILRHDYYRPGSQ